VIPIKGLIFTMLKYDLFDQKAKFGPGYQ